jgi:hypothetical protein
MNQRGEKRRSVKNEVEELRALLDRVEDELIAARRSIIELLRFVGEQGRCRSCHKEIFWVVSKNGKRAPWDRAGSHFKSCPHADQRRKKEKKAEDDRQGRLL